MFDKKLMGKSDGDSKVFFKNGKSSAEGGGHSLQFNVPILQQAS
jgi:hypothetical protein